MKEEVEDKIKKKKRWKLKDKRVINSMKKVVKGRKLGKIG